jgi:hypothetical protein
VLITVLKDILIAADRLHDYFDGAVPVDLWRAVNRKRPGHIFDFVEREFVLSNGRPRPADIAIENRDGVAWVCVAERPRGVSTFDKSGIPAGRDWSYIKVPRGTVLPSGLAIVNDGFREMHDSSHYTIAPVRDMPLTEFREHLHQLAQTILQNQKAV